MTCQSAVWNQVLFCDLLCQTSSKGILTDYDASVAFHRVLHFITVITCRRLGMPISACKFLYIFLHHMEFHIITGLGVSNKSFSNNEDHNNPGQGMLQGSSSAAPVYNFISDVTYCQHAYGGTFVHPITKKNIIRIMPLNMLMTCQRCSMMNQFLSKRHPM
jgi:hypothetical protein